jgi:hypothetical protein
VYQKVPWGSGEQSAGLLQRRFWCLPSLSAATGPFCIFQCASSISVCCYWSLLHLPMLDEAMESNHTPPWRHRIILRRLSARKWREIHLIFTLQAQLTDSYQHSYSYVVKRSVARALHSGSPSNRTLAIAQYPKWIHVFGINLMPSSFEMLGETCH